jgi:hypothetical protein
VAKEYSEEVQRLLKTVIDHFDEEDKSVRERQIRTWRRLKLLWEGFRNIYYSEVAHDWRIPEPGAVDDGEQSYYDKPMNIFRAYLESIIAALSITVPAIKCYPDDADDSLDLLTAKAGDQIAKLIYHHNDVILLWLHAWFIYCTEGMVAYYNYPKSDKEYGQYEENVYEDVPEEHEIISCPECGYEIENNIVESGDELPMMGMEEQQDICPNCGSLISPQINRTTELISQLIRTQFKDKTRLCLEAWGGLYVKTPVYARKQDDCPYLSYTCETHYVNVIKKYPQLKEKFQGKPQGIFDPYEAWGRLSPQYLGEYPTNNISERCYWLRPCAFDILKEEETEELLKHFPDGCKVVLANDDFAEACPEKLDERWTLTYNPMSDYLQHDPLGLLLVSVQEITNDLVSLVIQTIEHGVGQTFADPQVLNFAGYRQMETKPGSIYPAKPKAGRSLSDAFFEIKTATLSQEVLPFSENIQQLGQMVSGALPSLFGGALQEQKTASGYAMSREQALQRLQNLWKMFTIAWKKVFSKAIPQYIENIQADERDVQLDANGKFINVFIRRADLEGKIGKFELQANENLPLTWSQRKDVVMNLMQMNNEQVLGVLGAPENLPIIRESLGLEDFYIPGEDDRNKQYEEIKLLLDSEPIVLPPTMDPMMAQDPMVAQDPMAMQAMMPQEVPSVEVDPDIDNHEIEFEICRSWLVSDAGRLAKIENEAGYKNVLLHAKMHLQIIQQQAAMMAASEQSAQSEGKQPKETDKEAPIKGNEDVNTL